MEMQKSSVEKRRRKVVSRPVLVYSVKSGQQPSATTHAKESNSSFPPIWKA